MKKLTRSALNPRDWLGEDKLCFAVYLKNLSSATASGIVLQKDLLEPGSAKLSVALEPSSKSILNWALVS
jgi:hypothetical protein